MCKSLRFIFVSLLIMGMCALSAMAQSTTTGAIGGMVTNPNREVIPGATITVKNLETNKEDTAVSDDQGRFRVVNLVPGSYSVAVSSSGFAPFSVDKLIVEVGLVSNVDAALTIGPVAEKVTVTADAPVINTSQQDFSNNMNQMSINNLPINGQRWSNFALLNPGTVPDANFGLISFRGISGLLNNNTIDGGDNNQAFFSEEKGRTRLNYTTSPSSIREFQVNTSNYSAEYGRAAGGVVNAVTKSGTNEFHGQAFYYRRDNKWGARNPLGFLQVPASVSPSGFLPLKPVDVRNRWGVTVGGPVKKNKLFWIFTYDELRRNFPGLAIFNSPSFLQTVNTCASLADLNGPNGQPCNTVVSGTTTLFTQSLKNPSRGLTDTQINNALAYINSLTGPTPRHGNQRIFLPKIDWNINQNHVFTFSYNRLRWASPAGIQTQPTNTFARRSFGDDFVNGDTYQARLSSNFGPNMVNEARFQYGRDNEFEFSQTPLPGEPLTAQPYPGVTTAGTRSPDIFITNGIESGVATFLERPAFPDEKRWQYADTVTMTLGNHTVKFGGDFNHVNDLQNNLRFSAGAYSYNNINDFIIDYTNFTAGTTFSGTGGLAATVNCSANTGRFRGKCYTSNYNQGFGPVLFDFTTEDYNFFVQDDWRYTPRLTVNLGVRYEYERLPKPFRGIAAVPQTTKMPADKNNYGPRIGFAWDMSGNGKNSLRGGYGLYFGRIINSTILNALTNTSRVGSQLQVSLGPTLATCTTATPSANCAPIFPYTLASPPPATTAIQFFQNDFQAPAIHSMDLIYEREIARNTVVSGSLLMSFGRRLPTFVDTNISPTSKTFTYTINGGPFTGQTLTVPWYYGPSATSGRPNGLFGAMTEIRSIVSSSYYAFVAQLNRRLSKGLQFQVNYTHSKSRDVGQSSVTFTATNSPFDPFSPQAEIGRSNFDIPNKFVANAVWYPHFNVHGGASAVLNGWELAPIFQMYSGVPLNAVVSGSIPSPGIAQDPNCFPASTIGTSQATVNQCFTPGGGINGTAGAARFILVPRNSFRLPRIVNLDMRVSRRIHFNETTALEFLVEGFNVFNRTQVTGENNTFYAISSTAATCNAAHTTCTPASAVLNSSPTFQTVNAAGGTLFRERQVQMAVRFEF